MIKYPLTNKANKYARDVVAGKVKACKWVQLSCKRHLDDLKNEKKPNFPYKFDKKKSEKILSFGEKMPHTKGKWTGSKIVFEPWQCFFLAVPFGWVRKKDNLRRFREILGIIPRKNGKSVIGAVIGNYMFAGDGEKGSEVYSAATTEAQAYEIFRPAWLMTKAMPGYRKRFGIELGGTAKNPGNIYSLMTGARFETVVGNPGDGASPHCWLLDEYHEAKTDDSYDTGKTGMGARSQPMMAILTTTGKNTEYPCYSLQKKCEKILAGTLVNDEIFCVIYTIDKDDPWDDIKYWKKANPNFGISVGADFLKSQLKTAIQDPKKQNILKCKHLDIWANVGESAFNMLNWEKCGDSFLDIKDFEGLPLFDGVDLASKGDIASKMSLFKKGDDYFLFSRHYVPESKTTGEENATYAGWAHDGYLVVHPGARIDLNDIENDIKKDAKRFDLSGEENNGGEVCADPWNAQQMTTNLLNENIEVVEIPQNWPTLSEPMKELQVLIDEGKFHHDNNPVTTWMFSNTIAKEDNHDNIKPVKEKKGSPNKIDGAVGTVNAMARAMYNNGEVSAGNDGSLIDYDWNDF